MDARISALKQNMPKYSRHELECKLRDTVKNEQYEEAAVIRDRLQDIYGKSEQFNARTQRYEYYVLIKQ